MLIPFLGILTLGLSLLAHSSDQSSRSSGPKTEIYNVVGTFPYEIAYLSGMKRVVVMLSHACRINHL